MTQIIFHGNKQNWMTQINMQLTTKTKHKYLKKNRSNSMKTTPNLESEREKGMVNFPWKQTELEDRDQHETLKHTLIESKRQNTNI